MMQVIDNDPSVPPLAVQKIESETVVGARIGNAVVCFSKTAEPQTGRVTFDVPGDNAEVSCLVVDLPTGSWKVEGPGAAPATCEQPRKAGRCISRGERVKTR